MVNKALSVALAVAVGALLAVPALAATTTPKEPPPRDAPPKDAVLMTAPELFVLYAGKTWVWPNGGGAYTAPDRTFMSAAISATDQTYAEGRWLITNSGQMCWRATWHSRDATSPAKSCFEHMEAGGVIYQRSLPKGQWYVFAHSPRQADDEINKLQAGNVVTAGYQQAKAFLSGDDTTQNPAHPHQAVAEGAKK